MTTPDRTIPVEKQVVEGSRSPTSPADIDVARHRDLTEIKDQSLLAKEVRTAWGDQQRQDRDLRERFAKRLLWAMLAQAAVVNVAFFLIGLGALTVDAGTSRVFIVAVFGELAAMVFFIVKYLFRASGDDVLKWVRPAGRRRAKRRVRHRG